LAGRRIFCWFFVGAGIGIPAPDDVGQGRQGLEASALLGNSIKNEV